MAEAKTLMEFVRKVMDVERDFYDVVGARVYAELLGWYCKRIKDPYVMIGLIDGKLAGLVNGRFMNEDINISHHTMTFYRGGRLGAVLFYCKAYYAFEILGQKEFWSTYEQRHRQRLLRRDPALAPASRPCGWRRRSTTPRWRASTRPPGAPSSSGPRGCGRTWGRGFPRR